MVDRSMDRRNFLRASLAGMMMLVAPPAFAKQTPSFGSREGTLRLLNVHTDERVEARFRNTEGEYERDALDALNWILRCHFTNTVAEIDTRVIEFLHEVDRRLGGKNEIHVISGFRSPEYNEVLRSQGRQVVKESLHVEGKAIDFRIPAKGLSRLRQTAVNLGYGGVGYYPRANFVHLDSGRFRTW